VEIDRSDRRNDELNPAVDHSPTYGISAMNRARFTAALAAR
jgi:hypothetical protein